MIDRFSGKIYAKTSMILYSNDEKACILHSKYVLFLSMHLTDIDQNSAIYSLFTCGLRSISLLLLCFNPCAFKISSDVFDPVNFKGFRIEPFMYSIQVGLVPV